MKTPFYFLTVILFSMSCFQLAHAKNWEDTSKGRLTTQFGFSTPSLGMNIKDNQNQDLKNIQLTPHSRNRSFLGFGYGIFGGSIGWANLVKPGDDNLYGVSEGMDYQFRFNLTKFSLDFFYQEYKGYYVANSGDFIPNFDSERTPSLQIPSLQTKHFGVGLTYNFNEDAFSVTAAFDQMARQTVSGGAWLANCSANAHSFSSSQSLIPSQVTGQYGAFEQLRAASLETVACGGGGGYTKVYDKNWYLSGLMLVNLGSQVQYLTTVNETSRRTIANTQLHIKLGLGYNSEQFTAGLRVNVDSTTVPVSNLEVAMNTNEAALFVGWRWNDSKIQSLDEAEKLVP